MRVAMNHEEMCLLYCRRSIQLALVLIVLLSVVAIFQLAEANAGKLTGAIMVLLPIYIVISIAWLSALRKKLGSLSSTELFKRVIEDELRAQSLNRAFRSSFLLMLFSQIPIAYYFSVNSVLNASVIQSIVTIVLGVASFLTFFLVYDR